MFIIIVVAVAVAVVVVIIIIILITIICDMQALAAYAEDHIDDTEAPLFLRFINLLINDAIFLLDEALSVSIVISLSKIRDRDWSYTRHVICRNNHCCPMHQHPGATLMLPVNSTGQQYRAALLGNMSLY